MWDILGQVTNDSLQMVALSWGDTKTCLKGDENSIMEHINLVFVEHVGH